MKVTVDTNILVRYVLRDDESQAQLAFDLLATAQVIAITLPCLCEFVWVLRRIYGFSPEEILIAITALLNVGNVSVNRLAVEAGLATLKAGGDFADGVIAHEGGWLGGNTFVSFDRKAIALLTKQRHNAQLLA